MNNKSIFSINTSDLKLFKAQIWVFSIILRQLESKNMEPLDQIRKEIHTALSCVSQLCEQFFRKYPQNYPPTTPITPPPYQPYFYGSYSPSNPDHQSASINSWTRFDSSNPVKQTLKDQNPVKNKNIKSESYQQPSKKGFK